MANNMATMQGCCDCETVNPPCDCVAGEPVEYPECDLEIDGKDVAECLGNMLMVLDIEIDPFPPGEYDECSVELISGLYPIIPPEQPLDIWLAKFVKYHCEDFLTSCTVTGYAVDKLISCSGGNLTVGLVFSLACAEGGNFDFWRGEVTVPLPIEVESGILFSVDPGSVTNDFLLTFSKFDIYFYGKPCQERFPSGTAENADCDYCSVPLDFTLTSEGNCQFSIDVSVPVVEGKCAVEKCFWSDGNRDGCERTVYDGLADGCGAQEAELTLYGVDESGCIQEVTKNAECCACEDGDEPCAAPPGLLTVTQDEEDPCCWNLSASGDDEGYEGVCSDAVFIEFILLNGDCDPGDETDPDCTCEEIEDGECGGADCSGSLGFGDSTQICVNQTTTLLWRAREQSCGCWGPWNEETLTCINCGCCDKTISNVAVTLAGTTEESSCAGCPDVDGTYFLDTSDDCTWGKIFEDVFSCTCDPGPCTRDVQISLVFDCSNPGEITVSGFVTADSFVGFTKTVAVSGEGPWDCSLLEGGMTLFDQLPGGCNPPTSITLSFDYA